MSRYRFTGILIVSLIFLGLSLQSQDIPLPEHPRPDFQRENWLNLNGIWEFRFDSLDEGLEKRWYERPIFPEEIKVPTVDYVLGLADVIGEYRRLTLDALREGDAEKGEACLQTMDEIYIELMAMDEAYMLVPGLRRKCDVARRIIETTRGDVTQEVRRKSLENYLKQFEKAQKKTP